MPRGGEPLLVLVGAGPAGGLDAVGPARRRGRRRPATSRAGGRLGIRVPSTDLPAADAGQVATEGALLARYRFTAPAHDAPREAADPARAGPRRRRPRRRSPRGVATGVVTSRAAAIARDLANGPPGHLTASAMADVAAELGARYGFEVESFDKAQLIELGCGGILGVNAGSAEEPRMVKLRYVPDGEPTGHLGLVGKGIMYDSGGISIKPSDPMHLLMKMDMGGAAAVLGRSPRCATSATTTRSPAG